MSKAKRDRVLAVMGELGLAPGKGAPNLDAQPSGVLGRVWLSFQQYDSVTCARYMFPHRPKGYVSATLDLGCYAANKAAAVSRRLKGDIRAALIYETICERVYDRLPGFARW